MIPFAKGHGLGNDYIVIDEKDLRAPLSTKAIARICDRNWGVGSDGILLLVPTQRADFGLRIFNPDGSEAEKSGNGLRIFAKYLWDHGRTKRPSFTVDTKGGLVECQCRVEGGRMGFVTVEMGRATFRAPELLRGVADCFLGARLASRVGLARAKYLLFTAQPLTAAEALAVGLVARVVPHDELEGAVAETVGWVRQTAPGARRALKRDLNRQLPPIDFAMFAESLASDEVREGFAAFVEKRPPAWVRGRR